MKHIDIIIRYPLPDQLKALIEKLETQDLDARSLRHIGNILSDLKLTRYERWVVGRAYKQVRRLSDMNRIMEEVILSQQAEESYNIAMDTNAKLRHALDSGVYAGATAAQQAAVWNGRVPQPEQSKRVVVRAKSQPNV